MVGAGGRLVVLGGEGGAGSVEELRAGSVAWRTRPDLQLGGELSSFCAVALNSSRVAVLGGWAENTALDTVLYLDLESGAVVAGPTLPRPRYGHTCLATELAGRPGILVAGGALTGKQVLFLDLETEQWEQLPPTNYKIGKGPVFKGI